MKNQQEKTMLKHVGVHNNQSVVVIFREIPGEEHMALVTYTSSLPSIVHDDIMKCVESNAGQAANHFGEALHRVVGTDGQNVLNKLHRERWMKKVRTQDIMMTPAPGRQGARLDEINQIIRDLEAGGEAAKKLVTLDATAGFADPDKTARAEAAVNALTAPAADALSDADLAKNLLRQAEGMQAQVQVLNQEINRLMAEAQEFDPSLKPKAKSTVKKGTKKAKA
jgi:DNA polymerase III alpha subunit (gram-positive type)